MLYNSVPPEQLQGLVRQHVNDCLERFSLDQISAAALEHQPSNLAQARLFALLAEDPGSWVEPATSPPMPSKGATSASGGRNITTETRVDELMIVSDVYDHNARLRSVELITEAAKP